MMKLGYARVSKNDQETAAQVSALKSAGCEKIFRETGNLVKMRRFPKMRYSSSPASIRDAVVLVTQISENGSEFEVSTPRQFQLEQAQEDPMIKNHD
jgi:DNA invertase Pin-like site-specific DNA recombinase